MGSSSENPKMALVVNGEFVGLVKDFSIPEIETLQEQGSIEPGTINGVDGFFTLYPTKKFMWKLRWFIIKDNLARIFATLFPKRRDKHGPT